MVLSMECCLPAPRPLPPESWFSEILFLHDSLKDLSAGSLLFLNPGHLAQEKLLHLRKQTMFLRHLAPLTIDKHFPSCFVPEESPSQVCMFTADICEHTSVLWRAPSLHLDSAFFADLPVLTHLLLTFLFAPALPLVS